MVLGSLSLCVTMNEELALESRTHQPSTCSDSAASENTFSRRTRTTPLFAALCCFLASPAGAQQLDRSKFFEERVRPVLANHCFACHTSSKLGGLRMTSHQSLLEGGNSGPAIVPGQPDRSLLIQAVRQTHERLKMPPEEKLDPYQIDDLEMWIADGAYWPDVGTAGKVDERDRKHGISVQQRDFWAFRPVRNPSPPKVKNEAWGQVGHRPLCARKTGGPGPAVGQSGGQTDAVEAGLF